MSLLQIIKDLYFFFFVFTMNGLFFHMLFNIKQIIKYKAMQNMSLEKRMNERKNCDVVLSTEHTIPSLITDLLLMFILIATAIVLYYYL